MNAIVHAFHIALFAACGAFLAFAASICAYRLAARSWGVLRGYLTGWRLAAFGALAIVAVVAAQKRNVSYPRTDPTIAYLTDRDSYSTEDAVHIDFTRIIVPDSATFYLDRRPLASTNDADWVTFATGTFAEWNPPLDLPCENATNFSWIVYTDWTPGPTVQTNGVWHAVWGQSTNKVYYLPLRTSVRVDGRVIATPKSRTDNE